MIFFIFLGFIYAGECLTLEKTFSIGANLGNFFDLCPFPTTAIHAIARGSHGWCWVVCLGRLARHGRLVQVMLWWA